jgi:type III secretory pathway component EscR
VRPRTEAARVLNEQWGGDFMRRILSAVTLSAALMMPLAVVRADDDHHDKDHRYYDRDRKDYHEWNERENRAYRHWLEKERREQYREYNRLNAQRQREYWRWRHEHPEWER